MVDSDKKTVNKELKNARRGYTPLKGAKDTRVNKHTTIYTNTSLWSVTRAGTLDEEISSNVTKTVKVPKNYQEAQKDLEKQIKADQKKAAKDIKKKTMGLVSGGSIIASTDAIIQSQLKDNYTGILSAASAGQESSVLSFKNISTDFTQQCTDDVKPGFTNNSIGVKIRSRESIEAELLSEIAQASEFPPGSIAEMADKMIQSGAEIKGDKATNMLNAVKKVTGAVAGGVKNLSEGVAKWFEEQEAIIDALPTMSDLGGDVYIVEFREDYAVPAEDGTTEFVSDWFYTGETTVMDRQANQKIQELKARACAILTEKMQVINDRINEMLEESMKKCKQCQIFINIINLIKKLPSLTTIIKWAKSIIDSFIEVYKMIYGMFKSVMETIELVIVKGPQLINKIMKKVTEFDCPVSFNIEVNTKVDKGGK